MERLETFVKGEAGTLIFDENPIAEKNSDSLLACSHLCVRDTRCKRSIFMEDERKCSLLQITKKKSQLTQQNQFGVFYLVKVTLLLRFFHLSINLSFPFLFYHQI